MNVVYFGIYPGRCYDFLCHYRTPPFLIGFGRIRKLASVTNGGGGLVPPSPPRGAATGPFSTSKYFRANRPCLFASLSLSFQLEPCKTNSIETKEKSLLARKKSLVENRLTDRTLSKICCIWLVFRWQP